MSVYRTIGPLVYYIRSNYGVPRFSNIIVVFVVVDGGGGGVWGVG